MPALTHQPFLEAVAAADSRGLLATSLGHRQLARLNDEVRALGVFSARAENLRFLQEIADLLDAILGGPTEAALAERAAAGPRSALPAPRFSTPLLQSVPDAIHRLQQVARAENLQPADRDLQGTIQDPTSDARARLIIRTQRELMQGAGRFIADQDAAALDLWPCQELIRVTDPVDPKTRRDWAKRWAVAASRSGDTAAAAVLQRHGRMVARKDSALWQELGSATNFPDALGNRYAPFAFNSGMDTEDVRRDEAEALGVIPPDAPAPVPQDTSLLTTQGVKADRFDAALVAAVTADGELYLDADNVLRARGDAAFAPRSALPAPRSAL